MFEEMREGGPGWKWDSVQVEGRDLYFRRNYIDSDKIPIIHLHGFAISGSYLMPTAKKLAGSYLNIVPDLPGYGRSTNSQGDPLNISELAVRVVALIEAPQLPQVVLLGNSVGCPVALEVAHLAPQLVNRLILVSPAGGTHNQPLMRGLAQLLWDGPRERLAFFPIAIPDYVRFGPINMLILFQEMTRFPFLERLLDVHAPTLAVLGDQDPLMPPATQVRDVAVQAGQHVEVAVINGAGHAINFSHPADLVNTIVSWLESMDHDRGSRTGHE